MRNALLIGVIVFIVAFFCWHSATFAQDNKFLPDGFAFPGWSQAKHFIFEGEALFGHINGGAEVFHEFGFQVLNGFILKRDGTEDEITIEIYRMTDSDAAFGLFLLKHANLTPSNNLPKPNLVSDQQIVFTKGNYYVLITSSVISAKFKEMIVKIAGLIARKISARARSDFTSLPSRRRIAGSERLLRGGIALQTIYPLGEGKLLWSGSNADTHLNALATDYRLPSGQEYSYVRCRFDNAKSALTGLRGILEDHDPYLEVIESKKDRLVFKDWNNLYVIIIVNGDSMELYFRLPSPQIPDG